MIYGYHRTTTADQHLDRGISEIESFCKNNNILLEKIYTDQQTGKNFNRPRYQVLKEDILRTRDTLVITELDLSALDNSMAQMIMERLWQTASTEA